MRPRLLGLKSAVPPFVIAQTEAAHYARQLFGEVRDISRLITIFQNTGIERRYSCVPIEWYLGDHGWMDRTELYVSSAVDLLEEVTRKLLAETGLKADELDAMVLVSTTGVATPSLDALLVERMNLRRDIQRLPIFGLGCAGGVIGLARAAQLAARRAGQQGSVPGGRALRAYLPQERHLQKQYRGHGPVRRRRGGRDSFHRRRRPGSGRGGRIYLARFAGCDGLGHGGRRPEGALRQKHSRSWWPPISASCWTNFSPATTSRCRDIAGFACHPGGAKVLDALEDAMDMQRGDLKESRGVLRDFGNMSAVTALFVAERMRLMGQQTLLTALGPGFTAAFLMLDGR